MYCAHLTWRSLVVEETHAHPLNKRCQIRQERDFKYLCCRYFNLSPFCTYTATQNVFTSQLVSLQASEFFPIYRTPRCLTSKITATTTTTYPINIYQKNEM